MNNQNPSSEGKYVPPHRRKIAAASETEKNTPAKHPGNHTQKPIRLTPHASLRQEQRDISSETMIKTINEGEKLQSKEAITYVNEHTQVVVNRYHQVITVQGNRRNTNYDLLNTSNERVNELLKKIELENNDFAMCDLAEIYLSGSLGNREVKKAYDLLLRAANAKNSHAMCLIAKLHQDGDLGTVDLKEAEQWLKKAAERNNRYALAVFGQRFLQEYLSLNDTEKNSGNGKKLLQKTISFLKRSAKKGNTRAMWQLAKIDEEGWLGEKNLSQAIKQYIEAANLGSPTSIEELQRLVTEKKFLPEEFETILDNASKLIAKTSSGLAVQIGLAQIKGALGKNPQRGFAMLEQAAEKNNEDAMLELAKCYRDGIGCIANPTLSQHWFNQLKLLYEKAIKLGNINSLLDLGGLFLKGTYGKIDFESAEKLFIQAARTDDVYSIYYLGTLYIKGKLGDRDPSEGIPWINKAIEIWTKYALNNDIESIKNLINLYLNKKLGFKNYQKAAYWLSNLADKENNYALLQLMSLYLQRKIILNGDESDKIFSPKILELIKQKANEEEHPQALWVLARLHQEGNLKKEQNNNINHWAQKLEATLCKHAETKAAAALFLGNIYKQEGEPLPKNLQQAAKYLCLASNATSYDRYAAVATRKLKRMLNDKTYSDVERKHILAGILECANQLGQKAPYKVGRILGDIYRKGNLVEPDYQEAAKWYEIAINLNNSKAMYRLGEMHQTGKLNKSEPETAIKLFELAAERKNPKAIVALIKLGKRSEDESKTKEANISNEINSPKNPEVMYTLGKQHQTGDNGKTKDPVQAAFWFRKAMKRNHTEATFELAQLYNSGQLGIKTRPVAVNFFKIAAKNHHLGAIKELINIYTKGDLIKADTEKAAKWQMRETMVLRK